VYQITVAVTAAVAENGEQQEDSLSEENDFVMVNDNNIEGSEMKYLIQLTTNKL
jgi:hypothetical protein